MIQFVAAAWILYLESLHQTHACLSTVYVQYIDRYMFDRVESSYICHDLCTCRYINTNVNLSLSEFPRVKPFFYEILFLIYTMLIAV